MNILEIISLTYACVDQSAINAVVRVPEHVNPIVMTCSRFSKEPEKVQFYKDAKQGLHGEIQPYVEEVNISEYDIKCSEVRTKRDSLLANSDQYILRAIEQNKQPNLDIVSYRQRLRDIPLQSGFPFDVNWPSLS